MKTEAEILVASMKRLIVMPEWKDFVEHIHKNVIPAHKESCVNSSFLKNTKEAENQACLIEGILEAIDEPQTVIDTNDPNLLEKLCHACGRLFGK